MSENKIEDSSAPLIDHLIELRTRLIRSIGAFVVAMMVCFAVADPIYEFLAEPIKQAMINLVDNALAAIKEKGIISMTLTYDPILKMVRIEFADDGAGISDEDKTKLFEPNFSTKKAGMGLGLTIVNTIIADHNGMIRVQDNKPRGAKFVIELPV